MNRLDLEQIAAAVGGRVVGQPASASRTVARVSTDSRQIAPDDLFVALKGPRHDGHDHAAAAITAGAAAVMVSRHVELPPGPAGRPPGLVLVRDTLAALGRLAGWYRGRLAAAVVAVTGSNGKTTTKAMIEHMLAKDRRVAAAPKSFNNAIGLPLTVLSAESSHDVLVCEVGSNAPGEIAALGKIASPDIAVIVSIGPAHLERFRSLAGVAAEKASLLGTVAAGGVGIINADSPELAAAARGYRVPLIRFGRADQADMVLTDVSAAATEVRFTINGADEVVLPLAGEHNAINALAAITVGRRLGLSVSEAAGRLADFSPPPMRLQRLTVGGIELINDAHNANPVSMAAALDVFSQLSANGGRKVFICGDMLELGEQSDRFHHQLGGRIAGAGVQRLIAVGRFAGAVIEGACQAGMDRGCTEQFAGTEELVGRAAGLLEPGDLVLIKGSRGMALERVVEALAARQPAAARPRGPARRSRSKRT